MGRQKKTWRRTAGCWFRHSVQSSSSLTTMTHVRDLKLHINSLVTKDTFNMGDLFHACRITHCPHTRKTSYYTTQTVLIVTYIVGYNRHISQAGNILPRYSFLAHFSTLHFVETPNFSQAGTILNKVLVSTVSSLLSVHHTSLKRPTFLKR